MKLSFVRKFFRGCRLYFWVVANVVILLDQITKITFVPTSSAGVEPAPQYILISGVLRLIPAALNPKGAFSLGPDGAIFYVIASLAGVALITWFMLTTDADSLLAHLALGSLFGGALGNLIDRATLGGVRDFIDLHWGRYHWPTFNVADIAICVGVGALLWATFTAEQPEVDETADASTT